MSILLLGGPSAHFISRLIENNQEVFSGSFAKVIQNNINQYISTAISNLIKNKQSRFSQAFTALIEANYSNYISQSIANLMSLNHNYFEGVISPEIDDTAPATFTDFTDGRYWMPFYHSKWNMTPLQGGGVRFETNVQAQAATYASVCGYRFRPLLFPDTNTGRIVLRTVMQDFNLGNPSLIGSTDRHGVGLLLSSQDKMILAAAGRAGATSGVSIVGAICTRVHTNYLSSTTTQQSIPGSTWEARVRYEQNTSDPYSYYVFPEVRVDQEPWILLTGTTYTYDFDSWMGVYGVHAAVVGYNRNNMYPQFAGTVVSFHIDEGQYISF